MNFGKSTKADMESRLMDTERGGDQEGEVGSMERVAWRQLHENIYTNICKIDCQWEFVV